MWKLTRRAVVLSAFMTGVVLLRAATAVSPIRAGGSSLSTDVEAPLQSLAGVDKSSVKLLFPSDQVYGNVDYDMSGMKIWIKWIVTFDEGAATNPHISVQRESTSFWPTEVSSAGPGRLAVAGKETLSGNTVIEIWTFSLPDPFPTPFIEEGSGELQYPTINIPVATRRKVFDQHVTGKDLVRTMFALQGVANSLFVQFWDSRDLYAFDYATQVMTLVLSPDLHDGVSREPALNSDYLDRWSAQHATQGYVYLFSPKGDKSLDLLGLFDLDLDGVIDQHQTLTREEFKEKGLADGEQFLHFY